MPAPLHQRGALGPRAAPDQAYPRSVLVLCYFTDRISFLGYFFTLDPLGFRSDQYIALFGILGHMLCLRANGLFVSEWADWLIADFAKLCNAVKPLALHYLKSGGTHFAFTCK